MRHSLAFCHKLSTLKLSGGRLPKADVDKVYIRLFFLWIIVNHGTKHARFMGVSQLNWIEESNRQC